MLHCYIATLLHCYIATLLHCYNGTLLHCYIAKLLHCYIARSYNVTMPHCYNATLLYSYIAALLQWYIATLLHCYNGTLLHSYIATFFNIFDIYSCLNILQENDETCNESFLGYFFPPDTNFRFTGCVSLCVCCMASSPTCSDGLPVSGPCRCRPETVQGAP